MLHCRGGTFYVGHTDDLERRIGMHELGYGKGFTSDRLPVKLVWSGECGTRLEALEMERRVKGWSKAKKMALIRGDWAEVSRLARSRTVRAELVEASSFPLDCAQEKDGPSTSSGRTE
jgi:putative endonuclease